MDKPLFSFVHAGDLHHEAGVPPKVPEANARCRCLVGDLNRLNQEHSLDFVVFSGDVSQRGAADAGELVRAKACCDRLHNFDYWGGERPEECVDSNHGVLTEYHRGNQAEQHFVIGFRLFRHSSIPTFRDKRGKLC